MNVINVLVASQSVQLHRGKQAEGEKGRRDSSRIYAWHSYQESTHAPDCVF